MPGTCMCTIGPPPYPQRCGGCGASGPPMYPTPPPVQPTLVPGKVVIYPPAGPSEADIRRIIREEIERDRKRPSDSA